MFSSLLSLVVVVVTFAAMSCRETQPKGEASLGARSEQLAAAPREDLEKVYHRAWLAVRQNYADAGKLAEWQSWEHKYQGRIRSDKQLWLAIEDMLSQLSDKHTHMIGASELRAFEQSHSGKFIGIGIGLNGHSVANVFPNSPAAKAGLKSGDVIVAVNGHPVSSPEQTIKRIRDGAENTPVMLTVKRNNQAQDIKVIRGVIKTEPAIRSQMNGKERGGSIRIDNLRSETVVTELDKTLVEIQRLEYPGVVLDLRGVSGGSALTAAQVAALFVEDGVVVRSVERQDGQPVSVTYAVKGGKLFVVRQPANAPATETLVDSAVGRYKGKLVVLVDERTSGGAEVITAALQDSGRATVLGIKTGGKGTGQISVPLTRRHVLRLSNALYFTPNSRPIDSVGIKPDIEVAAKDRSTMFAKAWSELQQQIGKK